MLPYDLVLYFWISTPWSPLPLQILNWFFLKFRRYWSCKTVILAGKAHSCRFRRFSGFWPPKLWTIGAEPTGATGKLPRYSWQYRGKHILLPRYFWSLHYGLLFYLVLRYNALRLYQARAVRFITFFYAPCSCTNRRCSGGDHHRAGQ